MIPSTPRSLRRDERGVVAPVTAILMVALIGFASLAVDIGYFQSTKRQLQAATDAAALAATYAVVSPDQQTNPQSWVNSFLQKNGYGDTSPTVVVGTYCPDSTLAPASRFTSGTASCADPSLGSGPNAVKVTTTTTAPLLLSRVLLLGQSTMTIGTTATAAQIPQAGFYAGTGLLSINNGLLNAVLTGLLGSNVNLTAVQYQGLLNTNITALSFFNALATNLGVSAGTYNSLLQSSVTVQQVIQAEIDALNQPGSDAAAALGTLKADVAGSPSLTVGSLFDLGVWQNLGVGSSSPPPALSATLNAYQLASMTVQVANGAHAVTVPTSTLGIPGIATLTAASTIIEPPVSAPFVFGPVGMTVHTSQVRLQLQLQLLSALSLGGLLGTAPVSLPVYIEIAAGTAQLTGITCGFSPGTDAQVTIAATPSAANTYIGNVTPGAMTNFSTTPTVSPASLVTALGGLVTITGSGEVSVGAGSPTSLTFSQTDIANATAHTATSTGMVSNLLQTLVNTLQLQVKITGLGLGLSQSVLTASLTTLLSPVAAGLDSLVDGLLAALGIRIGYMDVTATGVRCGMPVLVY
jgi:uncharacterized membrane protein